MAKVNLSLANAKKLATELNIPLKDFTKACINVGLNVGLGTIKEMKEELNKFRTDEAKEEQI